MSPQLHAYMCSFPLSARYTTFLRKTSHLNKTGIYLYIWLSKGLLLLLFVMYQTTLPAGKMFSIFIWKCYLRSRKMCKDGIVSLKFVVIPLLEEIVDLLKIAFGPDGDMVMIQQKSPRETKVTKVSIFKPLVCKNIFTFHYCD